MLVFFATADIKYIFAYDLLICVYLPSLCLMFCFDCISRLNI